MRRIAIQFIMLSISYENELTNSGGWLVANVKYKGASDKLPEDLYQKNQVAVLLVAAKILGHNFIGIDISKEYVDFSEKRLKNYKTEEKYANEEIARHIVVKTFKERKEKGEFTGKYGQQNNKKSAQQSVLRLFEEF